MSENDFKKTYSGFTKFVLWGTIAVIAILVILAVNITLIIKNYMIVGSIKENTTLEKRVSITPESAKNIISLGLKVCVEKGYASSPWY